MAWINTAGYWIMNQTDRSSCGMACVCMVVHRKGMGKPTEKMVSEKSKKMDKGYGQALQDKYKNIGMPRMLTATSDSTTKGYEGTYMKNLSDLLSDWKISNDYKYSADAIGSLHFVSSGNPAIAQIDWAGGGSHFVLIEKFLDGPKGLIICDPFYGVHAMEGKSGNKYRPQPGVEGTFNGWLITT